MLEYAVVIQKGAFLGVRYCSQYDNWQVTGSAGTILGAQNLGTTTNPVETAYINDLELINSLNIADDIPVYFGNDNDAAFIFTSATPALDINLIAGVDFSINVDSVNHWTFGAGGPLLAGGSNPLPNIGSVATPIGNIYLGDDDHIYLGDSQDLDIRHSGVDAFITTTTGDLYLSTAASGGDIFLVTGFGNVAQLTSAGATNLFGNLNLSANLSLGDNNFIYLGESNDFSISWDNAGSDADLSSAGEIYFYTNTSTLCVYFDTSGDARFSNNVWLGEDERLYFGATASYISKPAANNSIYIVAENDILLGISNSSTIVTATLNGIGTSVPGLSGTDAYLRFQIGGSDYYFVGYTT